jgi:hypothetical protein
MPAKTPPPVPPTIAHLRAMGLAGLSVTCGNADCQHSTDMRFDDLGLPDETPFPEIAKLRRFTCSACGSGRVHLMPDWRGHRAMAGGGRLRRYDDRRRRCQRERRDLTE